MGSSSTPALARVDVRVINVNDNSPKFVPSAFSADLVEDANIGDFVVRVTAADNDKVKCTEDFDTVQRCFFLCAAAIQPISFQY